MESLHFENQLQQVILAHSKALSCAFPLIQIRMAAAGFATLLYSFLVKKYHQVELELGVELIVNSNSHA